MSDSNANFDEAADDTGHLLPEDRPWRKGLHDFSEKNLKDLKDFVELYEPLEVLPVKQARILLVGQIGAGKSSLFNTINSIYRGHVTAQAASGTDPASLTTQYRTYEVRSGRRGQNMNFRLCDTMGLEDDDKGLDITDFYYFLDGYVPDTFEFKAGQRLSECSGLKKDVELKDKIHVLTIVINAREVDFMPEKITAKLREIRRNALKRAIPVMTVLTNIDNVCDHVKADTTKVYHSRAVWEAVKKAAEIVRMPPSQVIPIKNYETETELDRGVDILALFALRQMIRLADSFFDEQMNKLGISLPKRGEKVENEEPTKESPNETPNKEEDGATPLPPGWEMTKNAKGEVKYIHEESGSITKEKPVSETKGTKQEGDDAGQLPPGWEMTTNAKGEVRYIHEESGSISKEKPVPETKGTKQDGDDAGQLPPGWEMTKNAKGEVRYIHEESGTITKEKPVSETKGTKAGGDGSLTLPPGWEMTKNAKGEVLYVHDESGTMSKERPVPTARGTNTGIDDSAPLPPGWEMTKNAKGEVLYVHEESGTMKKERPVPIASGTNTGPEGSTPLPLGWEMTKNAKGEAIYIHEESGTIRKERPATKTAVQTSVDDSESLPPGWEKITNAKGEVRYTNEKTGIITKDKPVSISNETKTQDSPDALPAGWQKVADPAGHTYYYNSTTGKTQWEKPQGDRSPIAEQLNEGVAN